MGDITKKMMRYAALGALSLLAASCSTFSNHIAKIPRNGFISHFAKSDHKRMPFDSYWDISDNKDWDERVEGVNHKSLEVYLAPVSLEYFQDMPADATQQAAIAKLREYFDARLAKVLGELAAKNDHFHLVQKPTPDSYRVEIALLSAKPGRPLRNLVTDASGFILHDSGLLTGWWTNRGSVSMGARYLAPNGALVAEVADFEYGQLSLVGMLLIDVKDFEHFAYQRQTIDQWVDEFARLFSTEHETRVRKPWFTFNPF